MSFMERARRRSTQLASSALLRAAPLPAGAHARGMTAGSMGPAPSAPHEAAEWSVAEMEGDHHGQIEHATKLTRRKPQRKPAKRKSIKLATNPRKCGVEKQKLQWGDVSLEISYERNWMGMKDGVAHLEIRVLGPKGAIIPLTDTGYRSHFISSIYVDSAGGAVPYVRAWLEFEAAKPGWKRRELASRQLSLF